MGHFVVCLKPSAKMTGVEVKHELWLKLHETSASCQLQKGQEARVDWSFRSTGRRSGSAEVQVLCEGVTE